jgi:hypothetical protein
MQTFEEIVDAYTELRQRHAEAQGELGEFMKTIYRAHEEELNKMKAEREAQQPGTPAILPIFHAFNAEDSKKYHDLETRVKQADVAMTEFETELAADPFWVDVLCCWKIVVSGKDTVQPEVFEEFKKNPDSKNFKELIDSSGQLVANIWDFFDKHDFHVQEAAASDKGWFMAMTCNEAVMRRLIAAFHIQFRDPLRAKLIKIKRFFAGFRIPVEHEVNGEWHQELL